MASDVVRARHSARNINRGGAKAAQRQLCHSHIGTTLGSYISDANDERKKPEKSWSALSNERQQEAFLSAGLRQAVVN
jgi:hypothetical protein